jgi:2-polyprenyl-6-methoxyphenol hydroxylase-like FAD-dependent oxidoreductase
MSESWRETPRSTPQVSEQNHDRYQLKLNNGLGDMFFLGLSATHLFRNWPEMAEEYDAISLHDAYLATFRHTGVPLVKAMPAAVRLRAQGLDPNTPPGTFQMRPLVYKMFVHQVEKLGIQVEFDHQVVEYYENIETGKGGVVTKDGKKHEADIVIAADGVGSKSQVLVGGQVRAVPSGRAMWRAAFPIEHLDQNPEVKEFFSMVNGKHPIVRTFLG